MGIKRIVDTSFWTNGKTDDFTPEDKYFMVWLLTNPFTTQLGIYEISLKQAALQLGYSEDTLKYLLNRFENTYGMIIYSKDTKEIAIKNYLRHSIIKGGKPVEDCIKKEMSKVKNKKLIGQVFQHISPKDDLNETVRKIINEYENDNDNDNDNENDVSLPTIRERIVQNDPIDPISYKEIKDEIMNNKGNGEKTCEWCGCKTTVLHKHHYPIPKRQGGKEIVNICSNCHHEFHVREGQICGDRHSEIAKDKTHERIIFYLNEKTDSNYRSSTKKTQSLIHARLKEGFTEDDFKTVIDKKCAEWIGDEKMEQYLRPETLFGTKFESYLNAKSTRKRPVNTGVPVGSMQDDLDGYF